MLAPGNEPQKTFRAKESPEAVSIAPKIGESGPLALRPTGSWPKQRPLEIVKKGSFTLVVEFLRVSEDLPEKH